MKFPDASVRVVSQEIQADIVEQLRRNKAGEEKKHNLPIPTTSFVGREGLVEELPGNMKKWVKIWDLRQLSIML